MEIVNEFDNELDEFDLAQATYQVWLLGYDKDGMSTDFEEVVGTYTYAPTAVEVAELIDKEYEFKFAIPEYVGAILVQVETVVDIEGCETNVGTIYSRAFNL